MVCSIICMPSSAASTLLRHGASSRHMSGCLGDWLGTSRAGVDVCETRRPPEAGVAAGDELLFIAPCSQVGAKPQQISLPQSNLAMRPAHFLMATDQLLNSAKPNPAKPVKGIQRKQEARAASSERLLILHLGPFVCTAISLSSPSSVSSLVVDAYLVVAMRERTSCIRCLGNQSPSTVPARASIDVSLQRSRGLRSLDQL